MRYVTALCLVLSLAPPSFARDSGMQITQQGPTNVLVQKDVAGERWALTISLETSSPLEVSGSLFRNDGSTAFVQCRPLDVLNPDAPLPQRIIVYGCLAADRCTSAPCDASAWRYVTDVEMPGSFLLP